MKFALILVVYIWYFLAGIALSTPNSDERVLGLEPAHKHLNKQRILPPSRTYPRYDELSEEERERRINRGVARMMQFATFLAHVDNYFTDKVRSLTKTLNQAMVIEDEEDPEETYYDRRRHAYPRISTTITSR